ncbi:MAG: hypothetical protein ACQ9ET_05065 [Nitrosomonadaceae bacterium]
MTFLTLGPVCLSLYLQLRAVQISERKLILEVAELGEITRRINDESQARVKLETMQKDHYNRQQEEHAEQLNHTNRLHGKLSYILPKPVASNAIVSRI